LPSPATDDIPLLAGVRLDEKDLLAARRPPWKLVWDRKTGARQLYRLDGSAPEREAIDPSATSEARQAERELLGLLEIAAATDRPGARARVGEIPAGVQESLRALGYEE